MFQCVQNQDVRPHMLANAIGLYRSRLVFVKIIMILEYNFVNLFKIFKKLLSVTTVI